MYFMGQANTVMQNNSGVSKNCRRPARKHGARGTTWGLSFRNVPALMMAQNQGVSQNALPTMLGRGSK